MNEEQEKIIALCRNFVASMMQVETGITTMHEKMSKGERQEALKAVLRWLDNSPGIPANSYTRELAREILRQLNASPLYEDYSRSSDSDIPWGMGNSGRVRPPVFRERSLFGRTEGT